MDSPELVVTAASGVSRLFEYGALVILLVLICMGLGWFCSILFKRNQELADKFTSALVENTRVMSELREMVRVFVQQKN